MTSYKAECEGCGVWAESHPVAGRDFCLLCSPGHRPHGERWKEVRALRDRLKKAEKLLVSVASECDAAMRPTKTSPHNSSGAKWYSDGRRETAKRIAALVRGDGRSVQ